MRFPRNAKVFRGQLDAAPFAALLFLLVIFLLLNSNLVTIPGLRIQLPDAPLLPGVASPTVVVAVDMHGQWYYEHQLIAEDPLRARLKAAVREAKAPVTLVVEADNAATVGTAVVRLSLLARSAGIHDVLLATREKVFSGPAPAAGRAPAP
ncbi:MAG: biopolymer transporter ExbD [Verrucomicrobia bacterium]|nr:biopolymer transporter ExbD [Verrucomicrobiota bacterium]